MADLLRPYLNKSGLLIATHNANKLREIRELVAPLGIHCISAADKALVEPVEDGDSFTANAMIKSIAACRATHMPALADDSGLVVPALGGDPGIYSARWAGPNKDFDYAMKSVRIALEAKRQPLDSEAHFVCVLSLALPEAQLSPDAKRLTAAEHTNYRIHTDHQDGCVCFNIEGRVDGHLHFPPRGDHGFGYDPIFIASGMEQTFAEIPSAQKQAISHRANAFKGLLAVIEPHVVANAE